MTYFFIFLLQAVLPIGLLLALSWSKYPQSVKIRPIIWLSLFGLLIGTAVAQLVPTTQIWLFFRTNLMLCVLFCFITFQFFNFAKLNFLWQFLLSIVAGIQWGKDPNLTAITQINVVNTDFILNLAAVFSALAFVWFSACLLFILLQQTRAEDRLHFLRPMLSAALFLIIGIPLFGDLLLSMMKLQVIELSRSVVSFVAKSGQLTRYANYFVLALQAVVFIAFFAKIWRPRKRQMLTESEPIEKRKKTAQLRYAGRTLLWGALTWLTVIGGQVYWDQVASRPPQLSEAVPVRLDAQNNVRIPTEQFKDNKLHRFIWHSPEGKSVRFFIINRLADKFSLGVVFDACLLCGDQGYVMQGNQVVCIGCGVYMFTPSIGKPGGCNPVPIEGWRQTETEVVISKESLEAGLPLFSDNYSKGE